MPSLRKLDPTEVAALIKPALRPRAQVAQEYDAYLADFAAGDQGRAELHEGELRQVVRNRLQAAARRRGFELRFRPSRSATLIFRIEDRPPVAEPQQVTLPPAPPLEQPANIAKQRRERRPAPKREQAGRYDAMLPRWMRGGGTGRKGR